MSRSNVSSKNNNVGRKPNPQDDFPPEIKANILRCVESPRDVRNLGETSVGFNVEAKRIQFRTLDLEQMLYRRDELGRIVTRSTGIRGLIERLSERRTGIRGLTKQLSKATVGGEHPLCFYVHEIKCAIPDGVHPRDIPSEQQFRTLFNLCDRLQVVDFELRVKLMNLPIILGTMKQLQHLFLGECPKLRQEYSFWSLLKTLTTTSPNIETIVLQNHMYKEEGGYPDAATVSKTVKEAHNPCTNLKAVFSANAVWTGPLLKYLTTMAPNLVYVSLYLKRGENRTELRSALEACFKAWSKTLERLRISNLHGGEHRDVFQVSFPEMEKLKELVLLAVLISSESLHNLNSITNLTLNGIGLGDIAAALALGPSGRLVLQNLTEFKVDYTELDRKRRKNVELRYHPVPLEYNYIFVPDLGYHIGDYYYGDLPYGYDGFRWTKSAVRVDCRRDVTRR